MGYLPELVEALAKTTIRSVANDTDEAPVAIDTLLASDDESDVFAFTMLLVGTARRCLAPAPPFLYVELTIHGLERLAAHSNVDDIVLTILSMGFGGAAHGDTDGVRMALGDAKRRGQLDLVLLRLAAVAAGVASLHRVG